MELLLYEALWYEYIFLAVGAIAFTFTVTLVILIVVSIFGLILYTSCTFIWSDPKQYWNWFSDLCVFGIFRNVRYYVHQLGRHLNSKNQYTWWLKILDNQNQKLGTQSELNYKIQICRIFVILNGTNTYL